MSTLDAHTISTSKACCSQRHPVLCTHTLFQIQEDLPHLVVVRSSNTGNRIPPRTGRKALCTTARVATNRYIIEHLRVLVDDRVQEADRSLTLLKPLLVQQVNNRSEDWCRCRSATNAVGLVEPYSRKLETKGRDVRVSATRRVENGFAVLCHSKLLGISKLYWRCCTLGAYLSRYFETALDCHDGRGKTLEKPPPE